MVEDRARQAVKQRLVHGLNSSGIMWYGDRTTSPHTFLEALFVWAKGGLDRRVSIEEADLYTLRGR